MKKNNGKEKKAKLEQKTEHGSVSRRGFLKTGLGLGALATASGLALNSQRKGTRSTI